MADLDDIDGKLGQILTILQRLTWQQAYISAMVWPTQNVVFGVYAPQPLLVRDIHLRQSESDDKSPSTAKKDAT